MAIDTVALAASRKYTDQTVIGLGGLKGAPATIKDIVHQDGINTVTFEWTGTDGSKQTRDMIVYDGTPIYVWESGNTYKFGDLAIYASKFYRCIIENSDIEFNDTHWNEIGSPDGNYDIVETKEMLPPRFTAADRKMYYCIADAAFYLWDGTAWVFQSAGALTADLSVTKTVGGVTNGTSYAKGTSLENIFKQMLNPREVPSFTAPTASISTASTKVYEKGDTVSVTLTGTLNRGTISPAYGTSGKRSGVATNYNFVGDVTSQSSSSSSFTTTVNEANSSFTVEISYEAGEQPKDSHGEDYSTPLPAGSVTSSALTFEFVNALWGNTGSAASITKQPLVSKSAKTYTFNFPACSTANPETFDVPTSWTITAVEVKNELTGGWDSAASEFTQSETTHSDAGGTTTAYTRYTCNLPYAMDAREIRIKWS